MKLHFCFLNLRTELENEQPISGVGHIDSVMVHQDVAGMAGSLVIPLLVWIRGIGDINDAQTPVAIGYVSMIILNEKSPGVALGIADPDLTYVRKIRDVKNFQAGVTIVDVS